MKAEEMFNEIGYILKPENKREIDKTIRYEIKNDYEEKSITFRTDIKTVDIYFSDWLPKNSGWTPQGENKHSALYGYWQVASITTLGLKEIKAITRQMLELGWGKA